MDFKTNQGKLLMNQGKLLMNQGKLLTKHKVPWFVVRKSLPWPIEVNASKIYFYHNIVRQNVSCE